MEKFLNTQLGLALIGLAVIISLVDAVTFYRLWKAGKLPKDEAEAKLQKIGLKGIFAEGLVFVGFAIYCFGSGNLSMIGGSTVACVLPWFVLLYPQEKKKS